MKLSKNLTLEEVTKSRTANRLGIDNQPTTSHLNYLKAIAEKVFQPCRDHFKKPLAVTSGYRSPDLNKAIGGAGTYEQGRYIPKSQHCYGQALDLDGDMTGIDNRKLFEFIKDNLEFDQLIAEYPESGKPAWIHVSYREGRNRCEVLVARQNSKGKTYYEKYNGTL